MVEGEGGRVNWEGNAWPFEELGVVCFTLIHFADFEGIEKTRKPGIAGLCYTGRVFED